jgi:hypothetical protein
MGLKAGLQFPEAPPPGWAREESLMEIGGGEPTDAPNHYLLAFLMPLECRARANAELPPNRSGN